MNSTFKPALLLIGGRVVAFAAMFFLPVVLVRIFDQSEFGTYKQVFLVYATFYSLAQCGMAESLFYFLPMEPQKAGRYAANTMALIAIAGVLCLGVLSAGSSWIARLLGNQAVGFYLPLMGIYLLLMLVSTVLEIVMTARKRFAAAASAYAVSDMLRAVCFIVPTLVMGRLEWLLIGAIVFASIRLFGTLAYVRGEFGGRVHPDLAALKCQLAYALPFAAAGLLADFGSQFHQYAVSHYFDAATFAIYAVGCLQIPLVDLVHTPVGNVMMIRMGEEIRDGRNDAVLSIWHDTTRKLALLFFPLLGLLIVTARELIVFLFTENYIASVPIFMIWSVTVLLPVLQTDAVMRVYAQTRFLLLVYGVKLLVTVALIQWFVSLFQLSGAALLTVFAAFLAKLIALARFKQLAGIPVSQLLPWKSLGLNVVISLAAGLLADLIKSHLEIPILLVLVVTGLIYTAAWAILAFTLGLITEEERGSLLHSLQRLPTRAARVGELIKGS